MKHVRPCFMYFKIWQKRAIARNLRPSAAETVAVARIRSSMRRLEQKELVKFEASQNVSAVKEGKGALRGGQRGLSKDPF